MSEPVFTQATERIYSRLPEIVRSADTLNDYALKKYISAIADVEDQVERLVARLTYLTLEERAESDYAGDYGYDGLPYSYFQTTDSRNSVKLTANNGEPVHLRTSDAYRAIPGSVVYVGAVFRTDRYETLNSYGLRLWYYDTAMNLISTKDVGVGNGSKGATWIAQNAQDTVPTNAYYVRVSPFGRNTSGAVSNIWVDDVYVRSHYEVVATMNLLGSGHNFVLRAEQELVIDGDFDLAADTSAWDISDGVAIIDHSLEGVPEIQSYRMWLALDTLTTNDPSYARQRISNIASSSTYTFSMYVVKDGLVADDDILRVTLTPDTGGPSVREFRMTELQTNTPSLLTLTWNSPESVSNVIVNIERVSPTTPSSGLLVNDLSFIRFRSDVSQINALGSPVTREVNEYEGSELFPSSGLSGPSWVRYATMTDPDVEPLPPNAPDPASSVSYIEQSWRQTKPGNTYTFSGEIFSASKSEYVDLVIWYRMEGKGWGEAMLHRIYAPQLGAWVPFERVLLIPEGATEFRVNLDVYKSSSSSFGLRVLSMKATADRSWYMLGSRPFVIDGFTTKPISYLSTGDLVSYTARVSTTGSTSGGYVGIRVYNGNEVMHESLLRAVGTLRDVQVVGAFQVPENNAELRISAYVNDPAPLHQAAYFISDLEVVYTSQQYVETPTNIIRNGGFEVEPITDDWLVLTEKVTTRKNLFVNSRFLTDYQPMIAARGTLALSNDYPFPGDGHSLEMTVTDGTVTQHISSYPAIESLISVVPGETITMSAEFWESNPNEGAIFRAFNPHWYNSAGVYVSSEASALVKMPTGKWVRHVHTFTVPAGVSYLRLVAASDVRKVGALVRITNIMIERGSQSRYTGDDFFDSYSEDTPFVTHTFDATAKQHVQQTISYVPPVNASQYLSMSSGYNAEDVPDRPDGLPLGATSDLVDPRTANSEWLPWLSQFVGKNISQFSSLESARSAMASGTSFSAGTIGAIQDAVQAVLSGTKTVRVFPMTTDLSKIGEATQWDISIVTRTSESPDISVMQEAVRLRNAKPAGVVFHFHKHQSTWDAVELANPTWDDWDTRTWTEVEESGLGS